MALTGLLASARYAIAPPSASSSARTEPAEPRPDAAAAGYAQLFARAYLSWDGENPEAHRQALAAFVGAGMEAGAGVQPPTAGEQQVQWTAVVQERDAPTGERVYTVAAQTDSAGLLYLSVSVQRGRDGALQLAGYPAFVGPPASEPAGAAMRLREVSEPALETVVERALRNYLAGAGGELDADLAEGARVSLPASPLGLETVQRLDWSPEGGDVVTAVVQAADQRGAHYTLAYSLEMHQLAGRWEVAAIQVDPDA